MLQHIALTVNDSKEIKNFYEDILMFTFKHQFSLDDKVSEKIFNVPEETQVFIMTHHNAEFEIFITQKREVKVFSHVCLFYWKANMIHDIAVKRGYKTVEKKGRNHITYFIWDRSDNMFEIKEITK